MYITRHACHSIYIREASCVVGRLVSKQVATETTHEQNEISEAPARGAAVRWHPSIRPSV